MTTHQQEVAALKEEVRLLKQELAEYKQIVQDVSAPIIPSIVPDTILTPISGKLTAERFELIISDLMQACHENRIKTVIIDFTAVSKKEMGQRAGFSRSIDTLVSSLKLMGAETFLVGFTPELTRELMKDSFSLGNNVHTFLTFKSALEFLMKKKGMAFV